MPKVEIDFNKNEDAHRLAINRLKQKLELIYDGGGAKRIEKQKSKGKLTARERITVLLDDDAAQFEIGAFAA
ncbi:MAG: acyl-CoA carboxylase subunit beta, partial [Saprospiraceae bacterium]|nr:acyl-CoA carboxylase subunit beta [Saprospiraceae bacterium]